MTVGRPIIIAALPGRRQFLCLLVKPSALEPPGWRQLWDRIAVGGRWSKNIEASQLGAGIAETWVWGDIKQTIARHDAVSAWTPNPVVLRMGRACYTDELCAPVGRDDEVLGSLALVATWVMARREHVGRVQSC
ncbi:MAG: hypothetical protein KAX78_06285, partial [Phycisphaerae bacterium]|nr:hypothetical protein [Phycisphaerae bacterium]